ncbi:hypothetical protein TNIN_292451 [Trichonephila inaurata madagascariensis]|uniref:Uncharacterized protein n=1 Tax=Trichonephila inaurata madagascariensis TaxID=2747483 RepID=A0A8X7CMX7_9ARAC|nr:hypothetical protein TNIN_292451 [Trichonephila inaurata madagascariensis]
MTIGLKECQETASHAVKGLPQCFIVFFPPGSGWNTSAGGVQCHHEGAEDVSPDHGGDGREPPESGRRAQEPLLHDAAPQHLLLLLRLTHRCPQFSQ